MNTLETLQAILVRLTPVEQWTTATTARDKDGDPVDPNSDRAVCWCLVGAIMRETPNQDRLYTIVDQLEAAALKRSKRSLPEINDAEGHDAVLSIIDDAIQAVQATPVTVIDETGRVLTTVATVEDAEAWIETYGDEFYDDLKIRIN